MKPRILLTCVAMMLLAANVGTAAAEPEREDDHEALRALRNNV